MSDDDDYERASDYLEDQDDEIFFMYNEEYSKLPKKTRTEIVNNVFYQGLKSYEKSANELREVIDARQGITDTRLITFMRRGKEVTMRYNIETHRFMKR